jgi:transcriptional regulator with PAS, ATPase and Fis domain
MSKQAWVEEFPVSVTVSDREGRIVEMNRRSREGHADDGGAALVGKSVLDCHPEPSRTKLAEMMEERRPNIYTIRKNGRKKLIYQAPWFENGAYAGFVELSLEIPWDMPHFDRDK